MARGSKILGLARLQKKLDRLPAAARDLIRGEMEAVANEVVAMMRSLVPVDRGNLRDSIGWTWGKAPRGATLVAQAAATLGGDLTITIYAGSDAAYYARYVEFGTSKMRAQPFFYVSWRANRKSAKRRVRKAIRDSARKVAAGN